MRKRVGNRIYPFFAAAVIAVLFACFILFSLSGCFLRGESVEAIEFRDSEIKLSVGESVVVDTAYIKFTPSTVSNKNFSLTTTDAGEDIIEIKEVTRGYRITGKKSGSATVTAKTSRGGKTADCTVNVSVPEPDEMNVEVGGKRFQSAGEVTAVDFSAVFDVSYPSKEVRWNLFLGDNVVSHLTAPQKESFTFAPETAYSASDGGVGLYTVTAQATGKDGKKLTATETVGVYKDYIKDPTLDYVSGALIQNENAYSPVAFSVDYEDDPANPERETEWFVNGVSAQKGENVFSFTPASAGAYKIAATVNGEKLGEVYTVTAKGSIIPGNVRLDTDNCYPSVILSWDSAYAGLDYEIEIRTSTGVSVYADRISTRNGNTADLFSADKRSADLSRIVGKDKNPSAFSTALTFRVRSLGDGKDFTESEYSPPVTSTPIDDDAHDYLSKKYYDGNGNFYVTDDDEFVDLFAYLFLWREDPVLGSKSEERLSTEIYMAYKPDDTGELIEYAFSVLHFTGKNRFEYRLDGNVLSLTVIFETDSLPSKTYPRDPLSVCRGGSDAVRPHFNTNGKVRSKLPIENRAKSVSVTTSEQLYYITQLGYKPAFTGSDNDAKKIYDYAANVLKRIVSDDMTDVEKAHAIYDYVMLQVNYDHGVVGVSRLEQAVKYSAYYLESVFTDDGAYAVCDGISKAYALMCNMEDLECIRVAGVAGADYERDSWGGHAWNKVKVDGEWYIVDCTWGDETMNLWDNRSAYYEMAFHRYFLLTDREAERSHGEDRPNNYPRTSLRPYNWYDDEIEYPGGTVDLYINSSESEAAAEARKIVDYFEYCRREDPMYKKIYSPYDGKFLNCEYIAFDIRISNSLRSVFEANDDPVSAALIRIGYRRNTDFRITTDATPDGLYMFIVLKTRY